MDKTIEAAIMWFGVEGWWGLEKNVDTGIISSRLSMCSALLVDPCLHFLLLVVKILHLNIL